MISFQKGKGCTFLTRLDRTLIHFYSECTDARLWNTVGFLTQELATDRIKPATSTLWGNHVASELNFFHDIENLDPRVTTNQTGWLM